MLENIPFSTVENDILNAAENRLLDAGNLNNASTVQLLKQMSYEQRKELDIASEYVRFFFALKYGYEQMIHDAKDIRGYIQHFSADPLSIIMYTQEQLQIALNLTLPNGHFIWVQQALFC